MKPETCVAIYAAIVGTGALLLNFKTWIDSGVKLKISLIPDGVVIGGGPEFDERDIIIVSVTNRGDASTMITGLHLFEIPSWWRLWRFRPTHCYLVANPQLKGYPPNVPSELLPAKAWHGAIRNQPDDPLDVRTGNFYAGIYASHRDRPYLKHIPKKKDQVPPGPASQS
jgi:hypothetical protein